MELNNNLDRVLVIVAHPDDEVLGMGGTISRYVSEGAEVAILIVTDGSTSQYRNESNIDEIIKEKRDETYKCATILGVKKVYWGNLPDMKLDVTPHIEINQAIENVIDEFRPNIVYTHFYGDINKDHRMIFESTLVACRPVPGQCVKQILLFSVPSSTEWNAQTNNTAFLPNHYVDISGEFSERKYRAMECYKTELREYPHPRSVQYLRIADSAVGNHVGLMVAECFMLIRSIK